MFRAFQEEELKKAILMVFANKQVRVHCYLLCTAGLSVCLFDNTSLSKRFPPFVVVDLASSPCDFSGSCLSMMGMLL